MKIVRTLRLAAWIGGVVFLSASTAQQASPANPDTALTPDNPAGERQAFVRTWAVFGTLESTDRYTLTFRQPTARGEARHQRVVFQDQKGCFRSGFGAGYAIYVAGKCQFILLKNGQPVLGKDVMLEENTAYTMLATVNEGKPVLTWVQESPLPEEEKPGLYVFHLLKGAPLKMRIGNGAPTEIPHSPTEPYYVPPETARGGPIEFIYTSRRGTEIRSGTEYSGSGRLSAVFMRDDYSKPTVFIYTPEPPGQTADEE